MIKQHGRNPGSTNAFRGMSSFTKDGHTSAPLETLVEELNLEESGTSIVPPKLTIPLPHEPHPGEFR